MNISVVICTYTEERWNELLGAIESVRNQTLPPRELIVVVDHNENLLNRLEKEVPGIRVLPNKNPRGLSGARNTGIGAASGEIIAFIDDDAEANPDWLETLVHHYERDEVIGVGGAILPRWQSGKPEWFPEEFYWVVGCTYKGMPEFVSPVRNLIGCNMSFRREVFKNLDGFHDGIGRIGALPLGCEETEFCIRIKQNFSSKVLIYDPSIRVFHLVHKGRVNVLHFASRCYSEGISKAKLTRYVGSKDGLSSELVYVIQALPKGLLNYICDVIFSGDLSGLLKSFYLFIGLIATCLGYLFGVSERKIRNITTAIWNCK